MAKESAGLLLYRMRAGSVEVFLAHPGGPFWARKDAGAWTIPKGEIEAGEDPLAAALREFAEETGVRPAGPYVPLSTVKQKAGKVVHAWGCAGDVDPDAVRSNPVRMEWPRGSGRTIEFPEIDRCSWFGLPEARDRINPAQSVLLDRLAAALASESGES